MRKLLLAAACFLFGAAGAVLAYAPYLPQIVIEGYPPLIWPAAAHFAVIEGGSAPGQLDTDAQTALADLPADLDAAFIDTGGKALLLHRAGKLEVEHYAGGVSRQTKLNSYSMAKSLVGALIFKALAEGKIRDLDVTLAELLPELGNPALDRVSLRALLEMRSGIMFGTDSKLFGDDDGTKFIEDTTFNPFGPKAHLHFVGLSSIQANLIARTAPPPEFAYQNVNTALLGLVLETIYRRPLSALASEKIWRPAGAERAFWRQAREGGEISAYCCIYATARDWIRVGLYVMKNGTPAAPFLPEALWRDFMGLDLGAQARSRGVYGYHIRHDVLDRPGEALQGPFTYLMGQGGQVLYLMPDRDLVVFRSGERMQRLHSTLYGAWNAAAR